MGLASRFGWVGDTLPPEVYASEPAPDESFGSWTTWLPDGQELHWEWCEDDFYATDAAGCYWSWAETKTWLDVEDCMVSSPDKSSAVQEAFSNFQRTFQESRTLNSAKHLSRGFYPLHMFEGKGNTTACNLKHSEFFHRKETCNQSLLVAF